MKQILFIIFSFSIHFIAAQEMKMHGHHPAPADAGNIYLMMMDTMMKKMDSVPTTSLADRDFLSKMIPHHEGAISMAEYEIANGRDKAMVQLAKSIVAGQKNDISVMALILTKLPPKANAVDGLFDHEMIGSMQAMMKNMPSAGKLSDIDKAFALVMIPHHQAAIEMAAALIGHAGDRQVSTFAKQLIAEEQTEIEQMTAFIK